MSCGNSTTTYRDVPGKSGYQAGDDGSIRFDPGDGNYRKAKERLFNGYRYIVFPSGHRPSIIHAARLVLMAFVGPCPPGMNACHFPDPDPLNCRLDNLMWGTHFTNMQHRKIHGGYAVGSKKKNATLTEPQLLEMAQLRVQGMRTRDIASLYGVNEVRLCRVFGGDEWKHMELPPELPVTNRWRTPEQVREIRKMHAEGMSGAAISRLIGVKPETVRAIIRRERFKDIT